MAYRFSLFKAFTSEIHKIIVIKCNVCNLVYPSLLYNAGIELLTLLQILQELKLSDGGEALNGMGSHSIYWSSHSFSRCCHWLWDGKTKTSPSTLVSVTNSANLMDIFQSVYSLELQMEEKCFACSSQKEWSKLATLNTIH